MFKYSNCNQRIISTKRCFGHAFGLFIELSSHGYVVLSHCISPQINAQDSFHVPANSRIGLTFETENMPISFDLVDGYKAYFRNFVDDNYPRINEKYTFNNNSYPIVYSIAAQIDTGE